MRNAVLSILVTFALMLQVGCATMIRGTSEILDITSEPEGALAQLSTGQSVTTPGQVKLKREKTVIIRYSLDGYYPESITVSPTVAGAGILLGGIIDYGTGAVYNLTPNPCHIILKPIPGQAPVPAPAPASTPTLAPAPTQPGPAVAEAK